MLITIPQAASLLKKGSVIAIPTDTVYGLAADMQQPDAVQHIFTLKQRPPDKPLIVLFSDLSQVSSWIAEFPPGFHELASHFWPGALTLVVPVHKQFIPESVRCGLPTAGFRIPQHPLLLDLLKNYGPLVAPSANLSGKSPATSADEVEGIFGEDFPVLDGGPCLHGVASTILIAAGKRWKMIRQGTIAANQLKPLLGYVPEKEES